MRIHQLRLENDLLLPLVIFIRRAADQALFLHPVQNAVGSGGPHPQVLHHIPLRLEETEALRLLLYRVIENLEEDRTTC